MERKIIFLIENHFSQRDYNRFGIEILKKNNFDVEIRNFSPFLHKIFFKEVKTSDLISYESHHIFLTKKEAIRALSKLNKDCFIISLINYNFYSYPIFKAVSRNNLDYAIFMANAIPMPTVRHRISIIKKFIKVFREPERIKNRLIKGMFSRINYKYLGMRPASLILLGGEKSFNLYCKFYPVGPESEKLWLHTLDYDLYLGARNILSLTQEEFGVFLDEDVVYHPDYIMSEVTPFSSREAYFPAICNFFKVVEKALKIKIVIAAHPRSAYEKYPDFFEGRPVIKGKTVELVKEAKFVIAHSSTSINFAVLFKKPIIFITTDDLKRSPQGPMIDMIASLLEKKVFNTNHLGGIDFTEELKIDESRYQRYKNDYIKKDGTEELPFWQIVSNYIKIMK